MNSPDYKGYMTEEEAKEDFLKRIENYKLQVCFILLYIIESAVTYHFKHFQEIYLNY